MTDSDDAPGAAAALAPPVDPLAVIRTRSYVQLMVLAAVLGVPISAVAYGYLKVVALLQTWFYGDVPNSLGLHPVPAWWPLPLLGIAGLLVGFTIRYLPGRGGHSPADGFKASGPLPPIELPGVILAALASLALGAVVGPEAPLIAIGSGLGVVATRLANRNAPETAKAVVASAGSFAAISALLGSPLLGAFLVLEASGLGGPMAAVVLVPGLLASGVGALIFIGLDSLTGFGTLSLAIPGLPHYAHPTVATFLWAIAFGVVAAVLGRVIRTLALSIRPHVERRLVFLTPVAGLIVAGLAIVFGEMSGKSSSEVLFSGETAIGPLIDQAAAWSVSALLLLIVFKGLAYGISLAAFRGGPTFPAMLIGAAIGIAASHLPGLELVHAVAMGIGAMSAALLRLPMTSVLLATLLLATDGLNVMPVVIVAVVVAYVATVRLDRIMAGTAEPAPAEPSMSEQVQPTVS